MKPDEDFYVGFGLVSDIFVQKRFFDHVTALATTAGADDAKGGQYSRHSGVVIWQLCRPMLWFMPPLSRLWSFRQFIRPQSGARTEPFANREKSIACSAQSVSQLQQFNIRALATVRRSAFLIR